MKGSADVRAVELSDRLIQGPASDEAADDIWR